MVGDTQNTNESLEADDSVMTDPRVDINILDGLFDKWFKDQEAVSGVLNIKVTRNKNIEFRKTLESWKKRTKERLRLKKRIFERGKQLRAAFEKYQDYFDIDKEKIVSCSINYNDMTESLAKERKEEKVLNDLLARLPESTYIETTDIERLINIEQEANKAKFNILQEFAQSVRTTCVMQQFYFSFFNIPEMLVRKKTSKKDFELIQSMLLKIKKKYLVQKALLFPDRPIENLTITDEDLVPLEFLDEVLGAMRHKVQSKVDIWRELIESARQETLKKIKQHGIESEKAKKLVEGSVFIHYIS